ncbi:hypothetical protein BGP77_12620 [Saccharospirillum sp. MSK14-1]|uniref:acyltransferase family protein n=1 Tax=Saccharospirillum sp. MSK14-1 TaxID=1897632 RepID=UPI000D3D1DD6|nr:acyltransferase [Saccharospirillum sp. MSK14-1]PTY38360.1 hypothetical protein BGP77_12620 [Saccharospirillum sp. MSK14-1]
MEDWKFRENSLDLIRLIAASQVMILHSFEFTMSELTNNLFFEVIKLFPGVPIFFFISGYLISKSYERSPSLMDYFRNRVLRIFPALILCVLVNIIMIGYTGYFSLVDASPFEIVKLFLAKSTFLQFYNPDFMRGFGDGVLNGSLWTICVELQFYLVVPIFYNIFKLKERHGSIILIILLIIFIVANRYLYISRELMSETLAWKLYRVSFIPWFYMFLFGVLVQRNFEIFKKYISILPPMTILFFYILVSFGLSKSGLQYGNSIPPYVYFPLAILILRLGYFKPEFTNKLLKGNDFSYGIYIWHMPFINQILYLNFEIEVDQVIWIILLSFLVAILSWFIIEKRMLKLKHFTMTLGYKK